MSGFRTVLSDLHYLECPRWHEDRIWVADFYAHQVLSARADGSDVRVEAEVPGQPSGLGWLPDGRLLIVSMKDATLLRRERDNSLVVHADLADHVTGYPNDMVVDAQGRAYVGNFGFDLMAGADLAPAALLRVDPDGTVTQVAEDLWFPNGSVITEDNVLLVDETFGNRVSAFDIAPDGRLANRRVFAQFGELPTSRVLGEALRPGCGGPGRLRAGRRGRAVDRRRPERPGHPGGRGRRDPRGALAGHRGVRLPAGRAGRPHPVRLLRTGLRRARPLGRPRGAAARDHRRRPARRPPLGFPQAPP